MSDTSLGIREFQAISKRRADIWHKNKPWTTDQWITAFIGEFGEFCNELKKKTRDEDRIAGKTTRRVEITKELADSLSYFMCICNSEGVDIESEVIKVFNEISDRQGFDIKIGVTSASL